jgi:glycosyltransferase involved in cell wall biosynthesis
MKKKLLIYVVSYNHELFINDCIDSIMSQNNQDLEVILIDSGSSDNSLNFLLKKSKEYSLQLYKKKSSLTGIIDWVYAKLSHDYEFVMRVDADDLLLPNSLQTLLDIANDGSNIGAVCGSWIEINEDSEEMCRVRLSTNYGDQAFHGACTLLRVSAISDLSFNSAKIDAQDGWYTWLYIRESWDIVTLSDYIFKYRKHDNNLTVDTDRLAKNRSKIYGNFFEKLRVKTSSCVVIGVSKLHLKLVGVSINEEFYSLMRKQLENIENAMEVDKVVISGDVDYLPDIVQHFSKAVFQFRKSDSYNLIESLKRDDAFKDVFANYSDIFVITPTKTIWNSYYFDLALYQKYVHNYNSVIVCRVVKNDIYKHEANQGIKIFNARKLNEFHIHELLYEKVPGFILFDKTCFSSGLDNPCTPIGFIPQEFLSHYS